ncbi:hypothetical protein [Marinilabilia rubra]|uniref:Uncharacterized protein n=1 Tax=Marinilabilia rubra TaxID=2162893 RepID=A0A2U2BCG0_9BACT|nr:hypothetical protein [Marinilabilia rubra]PWE00717.1 hypothetical protein DDZ16_03745 [Marinilabilia rubra]
MIQRDYILRMIEEIGRFIARLSGMRDKKLAHQGYEEFLSFLLAHYKLSEGDISLENMDCLEEKLKVGFDSYPDELGQLLSGGAEMAGSIEKGSVAETLYLLAWISLNKAEANTQTFRFERQVEMSAIKDKLILMGINVD